MTSVKPRTDEQVFLKMFPEELRPVYTHKTGSYLDFGSDWTSSGPKKLKILQLFIIRVADHRFKLEQKIGTKSPCACSILFRSGPIRFPEWKTVFTCSRALSTINKFHSKLRPTKVRRPKIVYNTKLGVCSPLN